jgi:hypothetical protein
MPERENQEQPKPPGSEHPEPAASFPFGAAMRTSCCGPAMATMAAFCRGEPEESKPAAPGEHQGAGSE